MIKRKIATLILVVILLSGFFWLAFGRNVEFSSNVEMEKDFRVIDLDSGEGELQKKMVVKFFDEKSFYDSLSWLKKNPKVFPDCPVLAAVVPHHDLAAFMPAGLFSKLSSQDVQTVIIIGPNHYEQGGKMLTSEAIWETKFGKVYPDRRIIDGLLGDGLVQAEDEVLHNDHSISGLLPMLRYYMPNVKIVPIMLSAKNSGVEIEKLNERLREILSEKKVVLVVSVDFSHYLNQVEAEKNDKITLEIIRSFDHDKLRTLGNGNVDSPASVDTFLSATQTRGDGNVQVIDHANSADLLGSNITKTTSYYSLLSCRKSD